jgi:membrane-associated phospholipid phosphatase
MLEQNWKSQILTILSGIFFISFAALNSVSRVTDGRHFWWDVLAGDVLAVGQIALTRLYNKNYFK